VAAALDHVWLHKERGRAMLLGAVGAKLEAALADAVLEAGASRWLESAGALRARQISASLVAALRAWLRDDVALSAGALASHLCASSAAPSSAKP
jgi:hypothetical protein